MPAALRPVLKPLDQDLNPTPNSNYPAPSFLWMRADALKKMPQPSKELKSSFYHSSLYFSSWSKIHVSSEQSPSERPQDSNSVHPPKFLHTLNHLTSSLPKAQFTLLSVQWSVWPTSWLRAQNLPNQSPHDGSKLPQGLRKESWRYLMRVTNGCCHIHLDMPWDLGPWVIKITWKLPEKEKHTNKTGHLEINEFQISNRFLFDSLCLEWSYALKF